MKKNVIWLIVGLILFGLSCYQNIQYEEKSVIVDAVITDIETVDDTDDGPISYKHTFYGKYTVDGKEYTNKKLTTKYTSSSHPDLYRGDTIEIRVYPDNPGIQVAEGGLFGVAGMILSIYNGIILFTGRKKKETPAT